VLVAVLSFLGIRFGAAKISKAEDHTVRLEIPLPEEIAFGWLESVAISPDGRKLVFAGQNSDGKRLQTIGAAQERLLYTDEERKVSESWTSAGFVLYTTGRGDMHLLRADRSGKPVSLLKTGFENDEPHVSPDGRWIAYGSVESGPWDIYVASFPDLQNKRQISNGGGAQPLWRGDGKELYYLTPDGKMMAVETIGGATLKTGAPSSFSRPVFAPTLYWTSTALRRTDKNSWSQSALREG